MCQNCIRLFKLLYYMYFMFPYTDEENDWLS